MTKGIEMREAHYPGRAPVDAYGNGGFRFAGMSHRGSVLFLPSGTYGWQPRDADAVTAEDLAKVLDEAERIEILLIGTGVSMIPASTEMRNVLRDHGIIADTMSTGAAVRTFNVLLAEDRPVAGAFIAVD